MTTIGKIDKELYTCITPNIWTDEVVITDERIAHIKAHHPNDYERFFGYIPQILSAPARILQDEFPNTGLLLKMFQNNGKTEYFRLALRIISTSDNPNYKNSVLTFWKTNKREYERLIRNKKTLYKSE